MSSEEGKPQLFEKSGIRFNGFRVPYAFAFAFLMVVATTAVTLYKVDRLEQWRGEREKQITQLASETAVLKSQVRNLEYQLRRLYGHPDESVREVP